MSKQSAAAVVNEAEFSEIGPHWPGSRRILKVTINENEHEMTIDNLLAEGDPPPLVEGYPYMGNGNLIVWQVEGITEHTVEIDFGTYVTPTTLLQIPGSATIQGNIEISSTAGPDLDQIKVFYSVSLSEIINGTRVRTKLKRVKSPMNPGRTSSGEGDPALVIERNVNPPGGDREPHPHPHPRRRPRVNGSCPGAAETPYLSGEARTQGE
ncbi:MAG TPA: hypothetical protein VKK31_12360 [Thermoanaerobaculia bacterium]|nr:hypothetical protein [Thermoanaerobaculia bacterium]